MRTRAALLLSVSLITACDADSSPMDIAGSWVLTFPSLSVPGYGLACTSVSGTLLNVEQDGNQLAAPYSQGLLVCGASTVVPFAQGRLNGTLSGNRLELSFEGAPGRFSGTVQESSASGAIEYVDPTYGVTVTGDWLAERRTPSGEINVTIDMSSLSGQPLPAVLLTLDGNTPLQAPQNGVLSLPAVTGGRHLLKVATDGSQSCTVTGGPSGAMTGTNPNEQFIEIEESEPPRTISYWVGCA